MKPIETGIQDASFDNYRKGNLQEILMAHGVPLSKVSSVEGASLAAARDADKTFKEQVCRPEQEVFEKKLNRIIKEVSNVFLLHLNELSLTDEDTQSRIDERYLRLKTYTPNEVRARKSMAGIPGGDQPVDLRPQDAAEQRAQALSSRGRDSARSANASDAIGEGRNAQGEGRKQD
jgi:phage portal protein BeeE